MASPLITLGENTVWENKHRTVSLTPRLFCDVWNMWLEPPASNEPIWRAGLAGLRALVAKAEAQNLRIRGLGGAWSLSRAAATHDIMVNTKPLNYIELGFRDSSLDIGFSGNPDALCFAQCGASVMELYQYLEARGYTLPTSGASNGQTIAGAVSTGTHGSANAIGSMQDYVLGLHMVIDGGRHRWIERASKPVVSQAFCHAIGAELLRDDALFDAAVVGFGSFGLMHAVLFEAEPLFLLEKSLVRMDYDRVHPVLGTLDVEALGLSGGAELPFHFEVVVNPYRVSRGQRGAYVRYMYKRPHRPVAVPTGGSTWVQGDDVMTLLGTATGWTPELVPVLLEPILSAQLGPVQGVAGTPGFQFGATDLRGDVMSTEIGVALADAPQAVDAIIEVANRFPWSGFPAIRYVKGSDATLAFTHFSPMACTIELPSAGSPRTLEAFHRVWDELRARGIRFTMHWGQNMREDRALIEYGHGARVEEWLRARRSLLGATGQRIFGSDWLTACGLG
ncbi:FAD-binding protein [Pendulispora rubella]|uniref:FAD-binding protein n=1 Tax=Pendulispora rubella TaxID=2741070 RepID=A0ABZ2KTK8_9BACT